MKKNKHSGRLRNAGFLFIMLWLIGFMAFRLYPAVSSLIYSFTDFNLFNGIGKVGLMNYEEIFTNKKILKSIGVTFVFAAVTVPLKLTFALLIAILLNQKIKYIDLFRTVYYIPSILGSSVAIAVLWKALFRDEGLINSFLVFIGVHRINWLSDSRYALPVISSLKIWQFGSAMLVFLAALKNVPKDLYEAAIIDGAGRIKCFFKITLPMITPVIFYNLITQMCQMFQEFNAPYIITQGGPRNSTTFFSMLIYNEAFQERDMGMASAMAWVLFAAVAILSLIAFSSQKYWVYYGDEK